MICVPGDITPEIISGIIADEAAIGMVNSRRPPCLIIPAIGKKVGEELNFGGLLGCGPVMEVPRIPRPCSSAPRRPYLPRCRALKTKNIKFSFSFILSSVSKAFCLCSPRIFIACVRFSPSVRCGECKRSRVYAGRHRFDFDGDRRHQQEPHRHFQFDLVAWLFGGQGAVLKPHHLHTRRHRRRSAFPPVQGRPH